MRATSIDLAAWGRRRPFSLALLHPAPRSVLKHRDRRANMCAMRYGPAVAAHETAQRHAGPVCTQDTGNADIARRLDAGETLAATITTVAQQASAWDAVAFEITTALAG